MWWSSPPTVPTPSTTYHKTALHLHYNNSITPNPNISTPTINVATSVRSRSRPLLRLSPGLIFERSHPGYPEGKIWHLQAHLRRQVRREGRLQALRGKHVHLLLWWGTQWMERMDCRADRWSWQRRTCRWEWCYVCRGWALRKMEVLWQVHFLDRFFCRG